MMDSIDCDLDFEKDLEEVRAASVQNYRTTRTSGYSATVIGQYAASERHSLPGGDFAHDHDEELQGMLQNINIYLYILIRAYK